MMKRLPPTPQGIAEAAQAIQSGEVVAYPTETVYGLAVNPFSEKALQRLFEVKGRDHDNPVLLIVADFGQLDTVVTEVSECARACATAFWPGPLSLLMTKHEKLPDAVTAGREKVCVRCPANDIARDLCRVAGQALTSTSANPSGEPPALSLDELSLANVAVGLDGGCLSPSPPSTIYDPDENRMLREGVIGMEQIQETLAKYRLL